MGDCDRCDAEDVQIEWLNDGKHFCSSKCHSEYLAQRQKHMAEVAAVCDVLNLINTTKQGNDDES